MSDQQNISSSNKGVVCVYHGKNNIKKKPSKVFSMEDYKKKKGIENALLVSQLQKHKIKTDHQRWQQQLAEDKVKIDEFFGSIPTISVGL